MKTTIITPDVEACEIIALNVVSGIFLGQDTSDLLQLWFKFRTELTVSDQINHLRQDKAFKKACWIVNEVIDQLNNTKLEKVVFEDLRDQNCFKASALFFEGVRDSDFEGLRSARALLNCVEIYRESSTVFTSTELDTLHFTFKIVIESLSFVNHQHNETT